MARRTGVYAPEAYAPNGVLWWELESHPGTKRQFGDVRKIAAWLAFNVREGDTFTMRDLRRATGIPRGSANDAEHLNRRLRELRPDGWVVLSNRNDRSLRPDTYRLRAIGWHPALGRRPTGRAQIPGDLRRRVLERDGRRCVVCFIGKGEPYPGQPDSAAVITVGHRIPAQRGKPVRSLDEIQTECQLCNETVRDELPDPFTIEELLPEVRRLAKRDQDMLLRWLLAGHRLRSPLDDLYDRVRTLSPTERDRVTAELRQALGE